MNTTSWDFEGYWNTVLGTRDANAVIAEFDLDASDRPGLDEWLGQAEAEAWSMGGGEHADMPAEWTTFHSMALDALHWIDDEITDRQIADLQDEAARAGNDEQVRLCQVALGVAELDGTFPTERDMVDARAECERAIQAARDMADE